MPKFTKEQQEAIDLEGQNIIVSAGAGSGKTAVLSERVLRKLKDGVNINQLLVLTFTNEAAQEMKNRIRNKISKIEILKEQLDYLDSAYITTFDSYALSIVKKYHYLLNIKKNVSIVNSSVISILKKKMLDEIFENLYEQKQEDFTTLVDDFCIKDDESLKKSILEIYESINLLIDKKVYLDNYLDNFYNDKYINELISEYTLFLLEKVNLIRDNLYILDNYVDADFSKKMYSYFENLFSCKNYNELKKCVREDRLPTLPRNSDEDVKSLKEKINDLKNELFSFLSYKDTDEIKKSLLETKKYTKAIINIIKLLDLKIMNYKKENNSFEFTDISKMSIEVLQNNLEIKEELKNYYNEILVDEYQDTSDLQEAFINLIENDNVYMVGDVKQSIYRFRNANPIIFKNKYDKYSQNNEGKKIDLLKNFRSRDKVLNNINTIFNLVMDDNFGGADYKKSHQMVFGNISYIEEGLTNQNYDMDILCYNEDKSFQKEEIEAFIVANDIKNKIENNYQIFDKDKGILRNITYSDICIIMDRGTSFDTYKKIFEYLKIPLTIYADFKLTNEYDIVVLKNIFTFIIKIKDKEFDKEFRYLFTSIARSFVERYSDQKIFDLLTNNNIYKDEIFIKSKKISDMLDSISITDIINEIIEQFDFYHKLISIGDIEKSMIRIENMQNIAMSLKDLGYDFRMFSSFLKQVLEMKEEIRYSLNTKDNNSVKIMNIHKSKGLEFNICYFTGLYKEFNMMDVKKRLMYSKYYGIVTPYFDNGLKDTIIKSLLKSKYLEEEISERIRLFYVALTRCKEKMIIVIPNIENDENVINDDAKLKYRSFLDIIKSIKQDIKDYMISIDIENIVTKDYMLKNYKNIEDLINKVDEKAIVIENKVDKKYIETRHASKEIKKLITKKDYENMEYGTYIHYLFYVTDFYNPVVDKKYINLVNNFLSKIDLNNVKIYKEHEFIYKSDKIYHGIIDLILEYQDRIIIIDYKLKNTTDKAYLRQLNIYKEYIKTKTDKIVETKLYSIIDQEFKTII